jgi:GxxExxY protein
MENAKYLHSETTDVIISAFYKVYNTLGFGFQERVYENALVIELQNRGIQCTKQQRIIVYYEGQVVGDYFADIIVADKIILELKATDGIQDAHVKQLMNYLRATTFEVGLVLNFGPEPEIKKRLFTNDYKKSLPVNWRG